MQHDFAGHGHGSENVGDVLSNIRRLIAQDQANRQSGGDPDPMPRPGAAPTALQPGTPLVLARRNRIPPPRLDDIDLPPAPAVAPVQDEPSLTPEEEAEFAEAEAALARMLAPPRAEPEPEPEPVPDEVLPEPVPEVAVTRLPVMNLFAEQSGDDPEPSLRELIRQSLHEELDGELGMRVSRQLHLLVRREVEAVLREICAEG